MIKQIFGIVVFIGILNDCVPIGQPAPSARPPILGLSQTQAITATARPPTLAPSQTQTITATVPPTPTPTPAPFLTLLSEDEVVLTIQNNQPYSGMAGEPKPDWVGWGAQAFSLAPNGEIWILDSAAQPQRLVHLAQPKDRLRFISLGGLVVGAADVVATNDAIWVLGVASQPPRVVKLSPDGNLLGSYDLPQGLWPENGLTGIALAQDGALLVELAAGADVFRLFDQNGQIAPQRLAGYTFDDRLYRVSVTPFTRDASIYAGGISIDINTTEPIGGLWMLGVVPDGSFYIELYTVPDETGSSWNRQIQHYGLKGELLGIAHPLPTDIIGTHDLIVGSDGLVYQLVSNPDHSVQIIRLGFASGEAAQIPPTQTPTILPTPLTPLLPTWTVTPEGASDLDQARHTLLTFFTLLHDGRYAEAVPLYGGDYETLRVQNPDVPADNYAGLWQSTCTHQTPCLLVYQITDEKSGAPGEFEFVVEFIWTDGTLFKLGPCCGATEADMPPVWQFPYTVKEIDGQFKVMDGPIYIP